MTYRIDWTIVQDAAGKRRAVGKFEAATQQEAQQKRDLLKDTYPSVVVTGPYKITPKIVFATPEERAAQ